VLFRHVNLRIVVRKTDSVVWKKVGLNLLTNCAVIRVEGKIDYDQNGIAFEMEEFRFFTKAIAEENQTGNTGACDVGGSEVDRERNLVREGIWPPGTIDTNGVSNKPVNEGKSALIVGTGDNNQDRNGSWEIDVAGLRSH
jgi:hypothetical protein